MPANTNNGRKILFEMAIALSEMKSARVSARTSDTSFTCGLLTEDEDDVYNYGLMRVADGTTYVQITDYVGATKVFTVGSGLTIAVGSLVEFCWWNADKFSAALGAMKAAVRLSWDYFFREVLVEAASSGVTLAAGDDDYDIPAACDVLLEIGIGANPIMWIPPVDPSGRQNYRVEGQPGALVLRTAERYSREGTLADLHSGKNIAWHYRTREPELTETGDTQLDLQYMRALGAWAYALAALNDASQFDLPNVSLLLPQLQQTAEAEMKRLGIGRALPSLLVAQQEQQAAQAKQKG